MYNLTGYCQIYRLEYIFFCLLIYLFMHCCLIAQIKEIGEMISAFEVSLLFLRTLHDLKRMATLVEVC